MNCRNQVETEEVEYIKDHEILYISKGEEFDEGSLFAEYKLLRELGQGGFGKVYEAKHRISKERVAIKIAESSRACLKLNFISRKRKGCRNDVQRDKCAQEPES